MALRKNVILRCRAKRGLEGRMALIQPRAGSQFLDKTPGDGLI